MYISDIEILSKVLMDIYSNIEESCKNCSYPDCRGYIYLLEDEVDKILDEDIEIVCLNNSVYLINNFDTDENGELNLKVFSPKCRLRCTDGKCSIHNTAKPLIVSAKYSCGFPNTLVSSIIVGERYLNYFTTITEDRL